MIYVYAAPRSRTRKLVDEVRRPGGEGGHPGSQVRGEPVTATLPRLSHSAVEDFQKCEELYRLKRVEKVPQTPAVWLVGGSAFHTWTERYELGEWVSDDVPTSWEDIFDAELAARKADTDVPVDRWRCGGRKSKDRPNGDDLAYWRDTLGPELCEKFIDWYDTQDLVIATDLPPDANGNTVGIEYELSFRIDGVQVKGFVDRIGTDSQGRTIVRDYKTGTRKPSNLQRQLYMLGLLKKGVVATHGDYYMARKGETTPLQDLTDWYEGKFAHILRPIAERIAAGQFVPHPGEACNGCDVFSHCSFALRSH